MQFIQTGEFNPNALEFPTGFDPQDRSRSVMKRFNLELQFMQQNLGSDYAAYLQALQQHYAAYRIPDYSEPLIPDLSDFLPDAVYLIEHPELARQYFNLHIHLSGLANLEDWFQEQIEIPQGDAYRAFLLPACSNLKLLTEVIDRETAFKLYKRFVTETLMKRQQAQDDRFANIEALYQDSIHPSSDPQGWVSVHARLSESKYAYKNLNCLWMEAIADFPDGEIKYYVCCYGDYQGAKSWNRHFILTMEHTLARGDAYCSRVVHDPRADWSLRHPPESFWELMKAD